MTLPVARQVLEFWFGGAETGAGDALEAAFKRWFMGGREFDKEIRERFEGEVERALEGGCRDWEADPESRLALIILLDQFPRNIFRRSARAFAGDGRALALAQRTVESGEDHSLAQVERVFLLMPYQHAENLEVQDESVRLFAELADEPATGAVAGMLKSSLDYAHKHREIISRFGRFPYRNEALGRETTIAERAWLDESGVRFGQ